MPSTPSLLFLCSGNYYRSRFAEAIFNDSATRRALPWRATSAGLLSTHFHGNPGPISVHTVAALVARGIHVPDEPRPPIPVTSALLGSATRVIALKEREHRPMIAARFPDFEGKVEFWNIDDVDVAPPKVVLPLLETRVVALVNELAT